LRFFFVLSIEVDVVGHKSADVEVAVAVERRLERFLTGKLSV
jgi:hypothetical protein